MRTSSENEAAQLLSGLRVADLGQGMAAAIVARFLADAGADVMRAEPATDSPFNALYPAYRAWHSGSRVAGSSEELRAFLAEADLCILGGEDHPEARRSHDHLVDASRYPRLVIVRIDGNPADLAGEGRPSTELLAQALSGLVWEQFPDRPVAMCFAPASIGAAFQALLGGLAALFEREGSGLGQTVRTSLLEGAMSWLPMFWADFETPTPAAAFITPKDAVPLVFRCRDGQFLHFVIGAAGSKYKLYQVLGIDDPTVQPGDSGMPRPGGDPRNFYGDIDLLAERCAQRDRDELLEALWAAGLPAEPVLPPGGAWDDPQIARNGVIVLEPDGSRRVGLPFRASLRSPAKPRPLPGGDRPLEGVRVVDFGAFVAGPLASQLLTGLGAEVVKVEPPAGEPSRGLVRGYLAANRGKKGVTLDLKTDAGQELARRLATRAHVVTSNFRAGVSRRLGIDPETLGRLQPDLIVLESPAYGCEGPSAERAGFDMVIQAVSGLEHRAGAASGLPMWNRLSMVDFAGGTIGAIALLCALVARRRQGVGVSLEAPLVNAGLFLLSELVQRSDGRFVGAPEVNEAGTGFDSLDSLYRTADGWIALVGRGKGAANRIGAALGVTEAGRDALAAALASLATEIALARLREAGIWAEPCRTGVAQRLLDSPALAERGLVRITRHAIYGRTRDLGLFFTLSRSPVGNDVPLHEVGEHDQEILDPLRA
ncbi:CoA transferase [Sphingosinicella terrae]|uniref:CoA transferase n=1 Tax=Sphingosinicella terrae TaxID=2172047 RepID=UPI000E0CFABF|nr:CoA transferase [Sphingosinicella terrae]